jgi:hypothetical protein
MTEERTAYEDARISRDRAMEAMVKAEDFPTKRSLWRLAVRMNGKMKVTDVGGTGSPDAGLSRLSGSGVSRAK